MTSSILRLILPEISQMTYTNVSTGIAEIITPADKQSSSTSRDDAYYDLQGRRIGTSKDNLKRGIYIHKGKKVIVR